MDQMAIAITAGEALSAADVLVRRSVDEKHYKMGTYATEDGYAWDSICLQDLAMDEEGYSVMSGLAQVPAPAALTYRQRIYANVASGVLETVDTGVFIGYAMSTTGGATEPFLLLISHGPQSITLGHHYPGTQTLADGSYWYDCLTADTPKSLYVSGLYPYNARMMGSSVKLKIYYSSAGTGSSFKYSIDVKYRISGGSGIDLLALTGTTPEPATPYLLVMTEVDLGVSCRPSNGGELRVKITRTDSDVNSNVWLIRHVEVVF